MHGSYRFYISYVWSFGPDPPLPVKTLRANVRLAALGSEVTHGRHNREETKYM